MEKQRTLLSYFTVDSSKSLEGGENETSVLSIPKKERNSTLLTSSKIDGCNSIVISEVITDAAENSNTGKISATDALTDSTIPSEPVQNDISLYMSPKLKLMTELEKVQVLRNPWTPSSNYIFPEQKSGNKKRRFQISWLQKFSWLAYSRIQNGAYCLYCVLFPPNYSVAGKGYHQYLGSLVTKPCQNLKDALELFRAHENKKYHKESVLSGKLMCDIIDQKRDPINVQLDYKKKKDAITNRKKLIPIVETLLLCGRQQIALRGHEDSGRISLHESQNNEGNFRALLRYRAKTDMLLREHLTSSAGNAMYTSPTIQNELLDVMGHIIQTRIVQRIKNSTYFAVLADETTDISQVEQFSLCVRYVDEKNMKLREDFLMFVEVSDLTGKGLAGTVTQNLAKLGLDLNNLRGQGYDGAAAMRGQFRGVQAVITETYPKALYTHCMSHSLNLCICDSSKVQMIRNGFGIISEVCSFFHASARRTALFKEKLSEIHTGVKVKKLKMLCSTRWVERHDAVLIFKEYLLPIVYALENLQESSSLDTGKAESLIRAICTFSFIITLCICSKMLGITHNLSESLQNKQIDLVSAVTMIKLVSDKIRSIRENAEETFAEIYKEAESLAKEIGVQASIPRMCRAQNNRSNVPANNSEEYFRRVVFVPYIDDMISSMNERFLTHEDKIKSLQYLLPSLIVGRNYQDVQPAVTFYKDDIPDFRSNQSIRGEWELWQMKWERTEVERRPQHALEALANCENAFYPSIFILLKILAVLPVTTSTVERTFSTLRRLKTYTRSTTAETRLTSLALLAIHRDIDLQTEDIINYFVNSASRRLDFTL